MRLHRLRAQVDDYEVGSVDEGERASARAQQLRKPRDGARATSTITVGAAEHAAARSWSADRSLIACRGLHGRRSSVSLPPQDLHEQHQEQGDGEGGSPSRGSCSIPSIRSSPRGSTRSQRPMAHASAVVSSPRPSPAL